MATVTSTQSVNQTYQPKMQRALDLHNSLNDRFINLSQLIENATSKMAMGTFQSQAQAFVTSKSDESLSMLLKDSYAHFDGVLKEHQVAMGALQTFRDILKSCTPGNITLTSSLVTHMTELGMMEEYVQKNKEHDDNCGKLLEEITDLASLVKNTEKYISTMQLNGNVFAYELDKLGGKASSATWYSSTAGYFFNKGLEAYRKSLEPCAVVEPQASSVTGVSSVQAATEVVVPSTSSSSSVEGSQLAVAIS